MSQGLPKLYKRLLFDRNGWKEVRRSSNQALKLHNSDVFDYGSMELGVIYIDSTTRPRIQDFYLNNTVTRLL